MEISERSFLWLFWLRALLWHINVSLDLDIHFLLQRIVVSADNISDFIATRLNFSDDVDFNFLATLVIGTFAVLSGAEHDLSHHFFFIIGKVGLQW